MDKMDEIGSRGWEKGGSGKTLDFSMSKSATSSVHDFCIFELEVWFQYRTTKSKKVHGILCMIGDFTICLECFRATTAVTAVQQLTTAMQL